MPNTDSIRDQQNFYDVLRWDACHFLLEVYWDRVVIQKCVEWSYAVIIHGGIIPGEAQRKFFCEAAAQIFTELIVNDKVASDHSVDVTA